jgi:tetratricopeptide (TPR) repeat protein
MGRNHEAVAEAEMVAELEPTVPYSWVLVGEHKVMAGLPEEAIPYLEHALELDPDLHPALWALGLSYVRMGQFETGLDYLQRAVWQSGRQEAFVAYLGVGFARAGRTEEANKILQELLTSSEMEPWVATLFAALDNPDAAFEWLERAFQARNSALPLMTRQAGSWGLRDDPRYIDLLKRIGLEP